MTTIDGGLRSALQSATQRARKLLEADFAAQLEATFDVLHSGAVASSAGAHLTPHQRGQRERIVAALEHKDPTGTRKADAVAAYVREAAFTAWNRFVALKMLESRGLVQECITRAEQSAGYREFQGLAPGVAILPDGMGYRLYLESFLDELSAEIKVLFDRRDAASILWPRRPAFDALLGVLNGDELAAAWAQDETIGWIYQYFNADEERRRMRDESRSGPRNSRELAVLNQFFTPRYVVQFLTDNTLGRIWLEMHEGQSALTERCEYFVASSELPKPRAKKDPRELKVLDPACGSGHFLLYTFDLLLTIYEEAWNDPAAPTWVGNGATLRQTYADLSALHQAIPALILEHNLHGVEIDPRAAQIAGLALWMRAQRAFRDYNVPVGDRAAIRRTHIVIAEPMPGDKALVTEFAKDLEPPFLRTLFTGMVEEMRLAGELGTLLRVESRLAVEVRRARDQFAKQTQLSLPSVELAPRHTSRELDLSAIDDQRFFEDAEVRIVDALRRFAESAPGGAGLRRRLFADDALQGVALIELLRTKFDVVLMNPPFGSASLAAKKEFERDYPRTKNDIYAAFVERGVQLLLPRGMLGAITSRTGFFLSSFQKWREEVLLKEARPVVVADLGYGVLDAMVEVAAYCLEAAS